MNLGSKAIQASTWSPWCTTFDGAPSHLGQIDADYHAHRSTDIGPLRCRAHLPSRRQRPSGQAPPSLRDDATGVRGDARFGGSPRRPVRANAAANPPDVGRERGGGPCLRRVIPGSVLPSALLHVVAAKGRASRPDLHSKKVARVAPHGKIALLTSRDQPKVLHLPRSLLNRAELFTRLTRRSVYRTGIRRGSAAYCIVVSQVR